MQVIAKLEQVSIVCHKSKSIFTVLERMSGFSLASGALLRDGTSAEEQEGSVLPRLYISCHYKEKHVASCRSIAHAEVGIIHR